MKVKVLFVCMGNICRSPAAQVMFERLCEAQGLADLIEADSAGTHAYHVGEPPDRRMQAAAGRRGIDLSAPRARPIEADDFDRFDYILVMDRTNLADLEATFHESANRPRLLMSFAKQPGMEEVPDPYYGGELGFERVLDLVEEAARGLLEKISRERGY